MYSTRVILLGVIALFLGVHATATPAFAIDATAFCARFDMPAAKPAFDGATDGSQKIALLIGVNDYADKTISFTGHPERDVCLMRHALITRFGFAPEDVAVLVNEEATRDAVLDAIRTRLIDRAADNGAVVFYYSGHGSQIPDTDGDETRYDGLDETIVPYDGTKDGARHIRDDEFEALFAELSKKSAHMAVIFDSCHSGDATRSLGRSKALPAPAAAPQSGGRAEPPGEFDYAFLAAAAPEELAYTPAAGETASVFTGALTDILLNLETPRSYREIADLVRTRLANGGGGQQPRAEGVLKDNIFLGSERVMRSPFVRAQQEIDFPNAAVRLDAGALSGLAVGAIYEIYPLDAVIAGDTPQLRGKALGRVEVMATRPTFSYARFLGRAFDIENDAPAALVEAGQRGFAFPLHLDSGIASSSRRALSSYAKDRPEWMIHSDDAAETRVIAAAGRFEVRDAENRLIGSAQSIDGLIDDVLEPRAAYLRLEALTGDAAKRRSDLITFDAEIAAYATLDDCEADDRSAAPDAADAVALAGGDAFRIMMTNTTPAENLRIHNSRSLSGAETERRDGVHFYVYEFIPYESAVCLWWPLAGDRNEPVATGATIVVGGESGACHSAPSAEAEEKSFVRILATAARIDDPRRLETATCPYSSKTRGTGGVVNVRDWSTKSISVTIRPPQ